MPELYDESIVIGFTNGIVASGVVRDNAPAHDVIRLEIQRTGDQNYFSYDFTFLEAHILITVLSQAMMRYLQARGECGLDTDFRNMGDLPLDADLFGIDE